VSAQAGLSKLARKDIEAIETWYRDRSEVLAGEFLADLGERLDAIDHFPESHALVFRDARQARLRRFPYMILSQSGEVGFGPRLLSSTSRSAELDGAARHDRLVSYGRATRSRRS